MPRQEKHKIYQIGTFDFRATYKIKVSENTHSIGSETETIELLNPRDREILRKQNFKILHVGAIQVAIKPLTRLGLNKPICACLRDARHNNFDDSLLGVIESNMAHDPVYFNCFLDLELSCIDDLSIQKALTLNVQTKGYDMDPRAKNILIVYRIYYKAMTTSVNAKCLLKPTKGKTLLFQSNEEHSMVMAPLEIPWESLTHSNTWNFNQLALPKPIKNRKPLFITQDDKGNVVIQFPPKEMGQSSRIFVQDSVHGSRISSPPRHSFEVNSRRPSVKLDNVDFSPIIPYPRYVKQESSPPTSPTPSQMLPPNEPHQLMVIDDVTKPFQIDKEYLSKELHLSKHREKRE